MQVASVQRSVQTYLQFLRTKEIKFYIDQRVFVDYPPIKRTFLHAAYPPAVSPTAISYSKVFQSFDKSTPSTTL